MSINFKEGVDCTDIAPRIFTAMVVAHKAYREAGQDGITVTSLRDGEHREGSLHYTGRAFDLRIWGLDSAELYDIAEAIRNTLGRNFDVVIEKNHIHIEYDPK